MTDLPVISAVKTRAAGALEVVTEQVDHDDFFNLVEPEEVHEIVADPTLPLAGVLSPARSWALNAPQLSHLEEVDSAISPPVSRIEANRSRHGTISHWMSRHSTQHTSRGPSSTGSATS